MSRNDLPSESSTNFNARIRETLMTYLGKVGDPLDRGITLRDLVDSGIVTIANLSSAKRAGSLSLDAGEKTQAGASPDLTPPPTPTGFTVAAAITSVFIEHDNPLYTQGHGHLRTHVYGVVRHPGDPAPVFADAAEITQFSGPVTSYATNPSTVWHLWIKWESVDGVLSASPAGGVNGLVATTGQDVSLLLQALTGQITESQLFISLGERIDLIDGPATLANSVAYLLSEEATLRAEAIAAEALARTNAIDISAGNLQDQIDLLSAASAGDVGALIASVKAEQDARAAADLNFSTQVNTLSVSNSGVQAAVKTEENTRITADLKEATRSTTLIARTGELTAGILNEAVTRTTADSSQAAQTQVLFASSGQNTAGLLEEVKARANDSASQIAQTSYLVTRTAETTSGLLTETAARSTSDSAQSSQVTSLFSAVGATTAGLTTETTVRSGADSAQAAQTSALTASSGQSIAGLLTETTARVTGATAQAAQTSALTAAVGANVSSLQTEVNAQATQDSAQASQTSALASAVGANIAGLQTEVTTRSTDNSSQAGQTAALTASVGENIAGLQVETSARVMGDSAQANQTSLLAASFGANTAALQTETLVRSAADSSQLSQYTSLTASVGANIAGLQTETTARVTVDSAQASQTSLLAASLGSTNAALQSEGSVRSTSDLAQVSQLSAAVASLGNTTASVATEIQTRVTADSANATQINQLQTSVGSSTAGLAVERAVSSSENLATASLATAATAVTGANTAAILNEQVARTTATETLASITTGVATLSAASNSAVQAEQSARAAGDSANAAQTQSLTASVGRATSGIQTTQNVFATQDSATAGQLQAIAASTGQSTAAVQLEQTTRTTADSAVSSAINTVQSQWGTNTAALQVEASTRATQTGELYAQYTVKIDTNGYVSGYGLATTAGNALPSSSFAVRADTFYIANPAGPGVAPAMPFIVRTTATTIGGVDVPVGVYMTDAFIQNGTITNAKIANLAVDDAKIANLAVDKLIAGSISAGQYIQSSSYIAGTQGFRLDANGTAEFQEAIIRGTVYATDGQFKGEVIAEDTGGNKARMWAGNFEIYKQVPSVGLVLYKALSRVESGVGVNNVQVSIPGYFAAQPSVIVSPASMMLYNKDYANQNQSIQCEARDLVETSAGSMAWRFTPLATLSLAANTGQTLINQSSGSLATGWTSSNYTTPANTASITPNITLTSVRGTGTSGGYYLRTVRWKVEYLSGGTWVAGAWTTSALGASAPATITTDATFTFPSSGTWTFRIVTEAYDTGGTFSTGTQYETATDNISRTGNVQVYAVMASLTLDYTPSYSVPSGWTVTNVSYSFVFSYTLANDFAGSSSVTGSNLYYTAGSNQYVTQSNVTRTYSRNSNLLSFTATGSGYTVGSNSYNIGRATLTLHSATGVVTRQRPLTNSTTESNSFSFNFYGYSLSASQVLATGSLNWIAIGE